MKNKFIAYDIDWDINMEEIYEVFDAMPYKKAAEALGLSSERYANMHTDERHDYIFDCFHHNRTNAAEFVGLPDEVEIPDEFGITNTDDDMQYVTDWLSDEYGYCINGYKVRKSDST